MAKPNQRDSAAIRAGLDHPVIDGDGHLVEIGPVLLDFLKDVAGPEMVQRYVDTVSRKDGSNHRWYRMTREERAIERESRPSFWVVPTAATYDRAAVMLPELLRERLDHYGIDYAFLYPTEGLSAPLFADAEMRLAAVRANNLMNAEVFAAHADRLAAAALIPMNTPDEALAELDFAVGELGLRAIMIVGTVRRPIPAAVAAAPGVPLEHLATWIDPLALDSAHDYGPVWQKIVDLKLAATDHGFAAGWAHRRSISSFNYNHIGHFSDSQAAFVKALFFGGVTRRFPTLKFGFLECGVGWACGLYNDLVGHWEKRSPDALERGLDPAKIDRALFAELVERHGDARVRAKLDTLRERDGVYLESHTETPETLDEWAACGIERAEDIHDLFVPNFYFGCEADDPMNGLAFNTRVNRFGARLKPILSSDIGHWDVPDATKVLVEAYELVERELIAPEDFRDFAFTNAAELHSGLNPDFFKGTVVESAVSALQDSRRGEAAAVA